MDTVIAGAIVVLAAVYLVKRMIGIFRPRAGKGRTCGCSDCNPSSVCRSSGAVQIRSRPD